MSEISGNRKRGHVFVTETYIEPGLWSDVRNFRSGRRVAFQTQSTVDASTQMLLACSVNTPIHDSRFHLLALRLRVQWGLGLKNVPEELKPWHQAWPWLWYTRTPPLFGKCQEFMKGTETSQTQAWNRGEKEIGVENLSKHLGVYGPWVRLGTQNSWGRRVILVTTHLSVWTAWCCPWTTPRKPVRSCPFCTGSVCLSARSAPGRWCLTPLGISASMKYWRSVIVGSQQDKQCCFWRPAYNVQWWCGFGLRRWRWTMTHCLPGKIYSTGFETPDKFGIFQQARIHGPVWTCCPFSSAAR